MRYYSKKTITIGHSTLLNIENDSDQIKKNTNDAIIKEDHTEKMMEKIEKIQEHNNNIQLNVSNNNIDRTKKSFLPTSSSTSPGRMFQFCPPSNTILEKKKERNSSPFLNNNHLTNDSNLIDLGVDIYSNRSSDSKTAKHRNFNYSKKNVLTPSFSLDSYHTRNPIINDMKYRISSSVGLTSTINDNGNLLDLGVGTYKYPSNNRVSTSSSGSNSLSTPRTFGNSMNRISTASSQVSRASSSISMSTSFQSLDPSSAQGSTNSNVSEGEKINNKATIDLKNEEMVVNDDLNVMKPLHIKKITHATTESNDKIESNTFNIINPSPSQSHRISQRLSSVQDVIQEIHANLDIIDRLDENRKHIENNKTSHFFNYNINNNSNHNTINEERKNWISIYSKTTKKTYYYHEQTGSVSWSLPVNEWP